MVDFSRSAFSSIALIGAERRRSLEDRLAGVLQPDIVVVGQAIIAEDVVATGEQPACKMEADKAGRSSDENPHGAPPSALQQLHSGRGFHKLEALSGDIK